ncbi:histone-lysine N-methyltransferase 2D-like [Harmonia axyridis]|uniref:histone-lysine N-methyltransferase 2D-like n=1 Tax=Harmonia axyridis TaxID=115357 RepID=UPI001E276B63|nr:histone-lysine N-methyltransferase 2D-like [Harmonia axyridis]
MLFFLFTIFPLLCHAYHPDKYMKPEFSPYCIFKDYRCRTVCSCEITKNCTLLPMDESIRKSILYYHNQIRQIQTNGEPEPSGMTLLQYDTQLEDLSKCWALRCDNEYSTCFRTTRFNETSQSVVQLLIEGEPKPISFYWVQILSFWVEETKSISVDVIDSMPGGEKGDKMHNYAQLLGDNIRFVGCSWSHSNDSLIFVCTYGPRGPVYGEPIYKRGKPCTTCPEGYGCDGTKPFQKLCKEGGGVFENMTSTSEGTPPSPPPKPPTTMPAPPPTLPLTTISSPSTSSSPLPSSSPEIPPSLPVPMVPPSSSPLILPPTLPPTIAPPTIALPTIAPPTIAPPTIAPPTMQPSTVPPTLPPTTVPPTTIFIQKDPNAPPLPPPIPGKTCMDPSDCTESTLFNQEALTVTPEYLPRPFSQLSSSSRPFQYQGVYPQGSPPITPVYPGTYFEDTFPTERIEQPFTDKKLPPFIFPIYPGGRSPIMQPMSEMKLPRDYSPLVPLRKKPHSSMMSSALLLNPIQPIRSNPSPFMGDKNSSFHLARELDTQPSQMEPLYLPIQESAREDQLRNFTSSGYPASLVGDLQEQPKLDGVPSSQPTQPIDQQYYPEMNTQNIFDKSKNGPELEQLPASRSVEKSTSFFYPSPPQQPQSPQTQVQLVDQSSTSMLPTNPVLLSPRSAVSKSPPRSNVENSSKVHSSCKILISTLIFIKIIKVFE